MDFDHKHPKWQLCCCHLTTGITVLGVVELVVSLLALVLLSLGQFVAESAWLHPVFFYVAAVTSVVLVVVSILLLIGIRRRHPKYLYPHVVAQACSIVVVMGLVVAALINPPVKEEEQEERDQPSATTLVVTLLFAMVGTVLLIYSIYLVVRCIHYLNAEMRAKDRMRRRSYHDELEG